MTSFDATEEVFGRGAPPMLDLNVERATKMVMEPVGPSALGNIQARLQRACDREGHPTAAGLVVERTKGIETFGHGLMTGPARIETLALILDGLRRHRSFVAEAEDRELRAGLERRVVADVVLLEDDILRHQEDGEVQRQRRITGDVGDEDLPALGRQLVGQRSAEFGSMAMSPAPSSPLPPPVTLGGAFGSTTGFSL
jgi:hypothetical protein